MSKLYRAASKSWWVPASAPQRMAVELDDPEQFQAALTAKVQALVDKEGGDKEAMALVNPVLRELGHPEVEQGANVAEQLLNQEPLALLAMEASPELDSPASPEVARRAVAAQEELRLLDLLL